MKDEAQPCLKSFCGIPTELSCSSETDVTVATVNPICLEQVK